MIHTPFSTSPMSWRAIEHEADSLRESLGLAGRAFFPVMHVLESVMDRHVPGFFLFVGDDEEMDGAEGLTAPDGSFILLHERVYKAAWAKHGRARFTAAHELGHLMLHVGCPLTIVPVGIEVPAYQLVEPQANQFAASLLMPRRFIRNDDAADDLVDRFGVSAAAATIRLRYVRDNPDVLAFSSTEQKKRAQKPMFLGP